MNWHLFKIGSVLLFLGTLALAALLALRPMSSAPRWAARAAWLAGHIAMSCWPLGLNLLADACLDPSLKVGGHFQDGTPVSPQSIERISLTSTAIWAILTWIRFWPWSTRTHRTDG